MLVCKTMKKSLLIILAALLVVVSCKKAKNLPEGPTDVRIKNLTTFTLQNVTVDIDSIVNFGTIDKQSTSKYIRFPKAYPKVKLTATVEKSDGSQVTYKTADEEYTYYQHMGRMKITYHLTIPNIESGIIEVTVTADEEIFLDQE